MVKKTKTKNEHISWKARYRVEDRRGANWYWFFWTIISLFSFLVVHFASDYSLAALLIIFGIIITGLSLKESKAKTHSIEDSKFILNDGVEVIPFKNIESYYINEELFRIILGVKDKNITITIPFEPNQSMKKMDLFLSKNFEKNPELKIPTVEFMARILGL